MPDIETTPNPLDRLRVVLVETSHPGNIGAAARAMKTMGLSDLALVAPRAFPHADATARASGADDVLARARVFPTFADAIADCVLVAGCSARRRSLAWPQAGPRAAAARLAATPPRERAALVFGRERTGLSNAELDLCHLLVRIPANPQYPSLNLAAAVQVLTYELRMAAVEGRSAQMPADEPAALATAGEMEHFYAHLERVLVDTGFLDPAAPRHLMRRLRRLFARARPDHNEANILRGFLTSIEHPRPREHCKSRYNSD